VAPFDPELPMVTPFDVELPPVAIAAARETVAPNVKPTKPKINMATYWKEATARAVAAKR
jgi:hypothetical protein